MPNEQTLPEIVIAAAESQLGAPYVYGTWGLKPCTVALRKRYASYNPSQKAITYKRCPVLSGKAKTCAGCKYQGMLAFDCRGFTHWCLKKADIDITGGYVARQWSDKNWSVKGTIDQMPDLVCCVFVCKSGKWKHTGLHIGGGHIIHCSGEVKKDTVSGDNAWSHYAVPTGLYTEDEIRQAMGGNKIMRTLKKGCQGEDVRALQEMLNELGYDCGIADGVYGTRTMAAVRQYQMDHGLESDGIAGTVTQTVLLKDASRPQTVPSVTQDELPEDDDEVEAPINLVALTHEKALRVLAALKEAQTIIEQALS